MVCSSTSSGTWPSSRLTAKETSGVKSCARDMLSPRKGHLLATYRPYELALRISHRLAVAHDDPPAQNAGLECSSEPHPVPGADRVLGVKPLVADDGLALWVDQCEVRVRAGQYRSFFGVQPVEACGPLGECPGEPLRRQAACQRLVN